MTGALLPDRNCALSNDEALTDDNYDESEGDALVSLNSGSYFRLKPAKELVK